MTIMRDIKKEVEALFGNMSDHEFDDLLLDSGFEVEEGTGEIFYKDESDSIKRVVKSTFKAKTQFTTTTKNDGTDINSYSLINAC